MIEYRKIGPQLEPMLVALFWLLDRLYLNGISAWIILQVLKRMPLDTTKSLRVLAFERGVAGKDMEMLRANTQADVIRFPLVVYKPFGKAFIPARLRTQVWYFMHRAKRDKAAKRRMARAIRRILPVLIKRLGVNALLTPNVNYWEDQAWAVACKQLNVPFVAVMKESVKTDAVRQCLVCRYLLLREHFEGHRIAVYSADARQMFIDGGVAQADQIEITGAPRTDKLYRLLAQPPDPEPDARDTVVLFAFEQLNLLTQPPIPHLGDIWTSTLRAFCELAERHGGRYRFVVKTKTKSKQGVLVKERLYAYMGANDFSGLEAVIVGDDTDFSVEDLIVRARVISSFNSTSLVEGMTTPAAIVVPCWGEASLERPDELLLSDPHSKAYDLALTPQAYKQTVERYLTGDPFDPAVLAARMAARQPIIEKHLYRIDGRSAERVAALIRRAVDECRTRAQPPGA